jgi:tRNA-binding EMAP/Myf-like protein
MGIENHKVNVIRIAKLEKHPNADSLSIVRIGGYQVVVRTEEWKAGDLAIYIQPDSVVPQIPAFAFLWEGNEFPNGIVPEKKRRITVRRFRKEYSEGLLMHVADLFSPEDSFLTEGDDVAGVLGIMHYEPPEDPQSTTGDNEKGPGNKQSKYFPRSLKGWFYFLIRVFTFGLYDLNGNVGGANTKAPDSFRPIFDVESIKNYPHVLEPCELVRATEKIHGSNGRYTFEDDKMYAGSRKLWKAPTSRCIWRKVLAQHPWITEWCQAHPSYTLYGEVVPTQGGFNYGCTGDETKFFVFGIRSPQGEWVKSSTPDITDSLADDTEVLRNWAPVVLEGPYDPEVYKAAADGQSLVPGANHIREGIVILPAVEREARNLGRVQLKIVSNKFLEKDSK